MRELPATIIDNGWIEEHYAIQEDANGDLYLCSGLVDDEAAPSEVFHVPMRLRNWLAMHCVVLTGRVVA